MFEIFLSFKSDHNLPLYMTFDNFWACKRMCEFLLSHFDEIDDFQVLNVGDVDGDNSSQ